MSTIVTRSGKGSPLTHNEVDANFTNLNTDKVEKTNAAITGGAIDNTVIGGTTPAAGTFTTLTATGQTKLGGASGSNTVQVDTTTNTGQYTLLTRNNSINEQQIFTAGGSGSNLGFSASGLGDIWFRTNSGGQAQVKIAHTASAVNYVQVTGGATGTNPTISMQGSDATVSGQINTKGAGAFSFYNNNGGNRTLRIDGAVSSVNFLGIQGGVSGNWPILSTAAQSSDTNAGLVIQSKGTGAIDLAAGSSGVNISNGGTVTAITRTAGGSNYTTIPSLAISAPTTAGGVQATATVALMTNTGATVQSGGTGYTVNDVLTVVGGTGGPATLTVTAVSGGVVTTVSPNNFGQYSVLPTSPVSVTGGTGSGATFNLTYGIATTFTITNAGSGYVEQPTVSFSGGGGSGATAYATVGSGTVVKSIGSTMSFNMPAGGTGFQVYDAGGGSGSGGAYWKAAANFGGTNALLVSTAVGQFSSGGSNQLSFYTNTVGQEQLRVSHTASAVNYVQVTGAATGGGVTISGQGSDANVGVAIRGKGSGFVSIGQDTTTQFAVSRTSSAVNYYLATGAVAGSSPSLSAFGSDTNIDLTLTPKGTGNVRFGTYTANMALTVQGYIEIKDSGGTVRKLAVIA